MLLRYYCTSPQDEPSHLLVNVESAFIALLPLPVVLVVFMCTVPFTFSESLAVTTTLLVIVIPFLAHSIFTSILLPLDDKTV